MNAWIHRVRVAIALAVLVVTLPVTAQERPIAFEGARIIPIAGPELASGTVVVQGGKILAVGPSDRVTVPRQRAGVAMFAAA
ncbi:MAG: hypothetical protein HC882_03755 [Acidobacteria bacterium]|nr:hypothetical protein [Acidobacteriota bacterium]